MCGRETGGLVNATAGLFSGAVLAFTPAARTSSRAKALAHELAAALGAIPLWLDPDAHDARVARTSHVPYLLSAALAAATPPEAADLIGPGFRSTARLAGSDPVMIAGVLATNRDQILAGLSGFRAELDSLERMLETSDETALRAALEAVRRKYIRLLEKADSGGS
jgi:prephenate dehydrogenase